MKKIFRILTVLSMMFLMTVPVLGASEVEENYGKQTFVNPIYAKEDIQVPQDASSRFSEDRVGASSSVPQYNTIAKAGNYLKQKMVDRASSINFIVYSTNTNWERVFNAVLDAACVATDETKPYEGDYLRWHFHSLDVNVGARASGKGYYYSFQGNMVYMSTKEQENRVAARVNSVLSSLGVSKMRTEYDIVAAVYGYITSHVTYDNAHLNDERYLTKYSAYGAIVDGTAICQGYANLMYRMLRQAGLSTRFIGGTSFREPHAWNIVRINGKYYNMDSTWDAGLTINTYRYFLKGHTDFPMHVRDAEYTTSSFNKAYPMASTYFTYSQSAAVSYRITYHLNGGKNNSANPKGFFGTAVKLKDASRKGYEFVGWYRDKNFKKKITTIPKSSAKNYTLYARWKKIKVAQVKDVRMKSNGESLVVQFDKLSGAKGYRVEYSKKKSFSKGSTKSVSVSNSNTKATISLKDGNKRYYVRVRAYKVDSAGNRVYGKRSSTVTGYKVTYVLKSGKNSVVNPYYYSGKGATLKAPTRSGYTFVGWYTDAKYRNKVSQIKYNANRKLKLYARWKKNAS